MTLVGVLKVTLDKMNIYLIFSYENLWFFFYSDLPLSFSKIVLFSAHMSCIPSPGYFKIYEGFFWVGAFE